MMALNGMTNLRTDFFFMIVWLRFCDNTSALSTNLIPRQSASHPCFLSTFITYVYYPNHFFSFFSLFCPKRRSLQ